MSYFKYSRGSAISKVCGPTAEFSQVRMLSTSNRYLFKEKVELLYVHLHSLALLFLMTTMYNFPICFCTFTIYTQALFFHALFLFENTHI